MVARLTAIEQLDRNMTENELLEAVVELAKAKGWLVYHIRNSRRGVTQGHAGFPDLVLARAGRILFAELKTETGKLSDEQRYWIGALWDTTRKDDYIFVWRPSHWRKGNIEALLK